MVHSAVLYLPMEIAARELDSRLLIALYAANAGFEVVMGQKWLLQRNAAHMPAGYWIFKTLTPGDAKNMLRIKALGHHISAIDEEMPGLGEGCDGLRWVDSRSVDAASTIYCLGEKHLRCMLERYPNSSYKLETVGNPRWDFLRPELRDLFKEEAASIRAAHGPFILVNTNVGLVNSAKNTIETHIRRMENDGRINLALAKDRDYVDSLVAFERANLAATPSLIRALSKSFPKHNIVLRPHPTEDLGVYLRIVADVPRVRVVREGSVAPWLTACEALIHTNCTTGTEFFALGRLSICYHTIDTPFHDTFLSAQLSKVATSETDLIDSVRSALKGELSATQDQLRLFSTFFAAQTGQLSAARIVSSLERNSTCNDGNLDLETRWHPGWLFRRRRWSTSFQRRIFPDFSSDEIADRMTQIAHTGKVAPIPQVARVGNGLYHIFPAGMRHAARSRRRYLPI